MKKSTLATIAVILLVALALSAIPTSRDEIHWLFASYKDDYDSYESYVKKWPDGRHADEAQRRCDERGWSGTLATNSVQGFERYIQNNGDGKHVAEAKDKIEQLYWQEATAANTIQGFERYIQFNGDGKHVAEAKDKIEQLYWQEATTANMIQTFERYIQFNGDGKHVAEAKDKIEQLYWQKATATNTIKSYGTYASAYPQGRFAKEAETKISDLRNDDEPFAEALRTGQEESFKQFLKDFPGHRKEPDALRVIKDITEGREIVDLLKEKKIEVQTIGNGIQSIGVIIRNLVTYPITVQIPVGTYFVSSNKSAQNMVTTSESRVRLAGDGRQSVNVSVACANRQKNIPYANDTFTVQRSPHQAELARLLPALDKSRVDFATRQAAVWIVTDNASYSDLGVLVTRQISYLSGGPGGNRNINETEAARAMKICGEAGIDITRKRIWNDRQKILRGLVNVDLKNWLQNKK